MPERWGRVYLDWMENLRPWCISRQLWWGHQIPVWTCEGCNELIVQESEPRGCPKCGGPLTRETDVLDTWFSSALWPFATWGWPDETSDSAYFYPTALLSTAREIIFLWVARMIMMGLEFMGDIPFKDVYIHSVIQAADGRRMSKSLGTGIDPIEMIDKYGADATRFGLLLMSSIQDVRFSEEKIGMGRNFANKLWNAARLVLLASEGVAARRSDADQVDRWITARLARAIEGTAAALAAYDFAAAVDGLYHFVWDEFCDWYLEMVKVRLYGEDEEARVQAAGHARFILDAIVKLMHPFLPFVTEEIAGLYGAAPLIQTVAPAVLTPLEAAADERAIAALQGAVNALRAYRAESGVPPGQTLAAAVLPEDEAFAELYRAYAPVVRVLARTELTDGEGAGGDVVIAPGATLQVATAVADQGAERERLSVLLAKLAGEVKRAEAKLANESFVSRAPKAVVDKEREKLRGYRADRDEVAARLADLA